MKKKLLVVCILAVFLLVVISFTSVVGYNTSKPIKKESPLFGIRGRRAIYEKIGDILENIKTRYIGERLFFLPFKCFKDKGKLYPRNFLKDPQSILCNWTDLCDWTEGEGCTTMPSFCYCESYDKPC